MSHKIVGLARWKRFGKGRHCSELVRKAIFCSLADLADNSGDGIFAAVPTIALLAGCSDRNVQHALGEFASEGLIQFVGSVPCRGGYTREWRIVREALAALPDVKVAKPVRTSAPESGEVASPVGAVKVAKPVRTSAEVVKSRPPSGEEDSPKPRNQKDISRSEVERVLEALWEIWPNVSRARHSKDEVKAAIRGQLRAGADADAMIEAGRRYVPEAGKDGPRFVKGLERWLKRGLWENWAPPPPPSAEEIAAETAISRRRDIYRAFVRGTHTWGDEPIPSDEEIAAVRAAYEGGEGADHVRTEQAQ